MPFPANFVTSVKLPISVTLQAKSGHRRAAAKETALEEAELRALLHPFVGQVASVRQVRAVAAPGPRALAAHSEQDQESRHVVAPEATRFGQVWGETPGTWANAGYFLQIHGQQGEKRRKLVIFP